MLASSLPAMLAAAPALAQTAAEPPLRAATPWRVDAEVQRVDVSRNVAQRPNDGGGTRFSVNDDAPSTVNAGWLAAYREVGGWDAQGELRVVIAPFAQSGTATPTAPVAYDGGVFSAGVPLSVRYKFNTYRITYDVPVFGATPAEGWALRLGGTLAVRDAQIRLSQAGQVRDFTNKGVVPLLYFSGTRVLGASWRLLGEVDAFPAPGGGGLFDAASKLAYGVSKDMALTLGLRYQIGGATAPGIFNALRLWSATAGLSFGF